MELRKHRGSILALSGILATVMTIGGLGVATEPAHAAPVSSTVAAKPSIFVAPMADCHLFWFCGRIYYTKTGSKHKGYKLLIAKNWPSKKPQKRLASKHYSTEYWKDTDAFYATKMKGCKTTRLIPADPPQPGHWVKVSPGWHKISDTLGVYHISVDCR